MALDVTEMPRFLSISIQSLVAARAALRDFTAPAWWIAPPYKSSFSVSVVLPASGCEMIAKVRRFSYGCMARYCSGSRCRGFSGDTPLDGNPSLSKCALEREGQVR